MAYPGEGKNTYLSSQVDEMVEVSPGEEAKKLGTEYDQRGMVRMGRKQELRRQFHFTSITGYAIILGCSWEFAMINIIITLTNGGPAGSIYAVLVAVCGMLFVQMSFAEMASIAPTSGGQYHWCSEFAPKSFQKCLSYFVGIFSMLGWQTSLAAVCYAGGQQVAALANLGNPNFAATNWQIALISFSILLLVILANTVLFRSLPLIEGCIMVLHVFAFFAFIVVLWVMAPRSKASEVFTNFQGDGWPNTGVAFLTALTGPAAYLSIADSAVHLAEEVKNAAYIVPRAMIVTAVSNYALAFIVVVTCIFCLGDLDAVLKSPIGQPYLAIILNATHSKAGTMVLAVVMLVLVASCAVNGLTTISRQIWSFARDGGPPFSRWLSVVRPGWDIPLNAMMVSVIFSIILNLIAMGSDIAYNMLLTLNVSGLMTSYFICVACVFYRRNWGEPLPPSRFSLGKAGNIINVVSLLFLALIWTFQFFPPAPNPTPAEMNWGSAVYGFVLIASALYYIFRARFTYEGPVVNVRKDI